MKSKIDSRCYLLSERTDLEKAFLREEGVAACRDGRSLRDLQFARILLSRALPQSPAAPAFGPGRKHGLLPALAKNMPPAYFLNASRPPGGSLLRIAGKTVEMFTKLWYNKVTNHERRLL